MRSATLRTVVGSLSLAALATVLLTYTPPAAALQQALPAPPAGPVPAQPNDAKKDKPHSVEAMTFPSDRDARQMIKAVQDYLEEHKGKEDKAPWEKICFAAQQVLDAKSDSFLEVTRMDDDSGKIQRVSAKAEANRLIGSFPAAGRQFYQLAYGPPADALLKAAKDNGYDRATLAEVSQRYFHTKAGAQATLLLAGLNLDRGNYIESAYSFERLLDRPDSDDLWTARTLFKTLVAFKRAGGQPPEVTQKLAEQLERKFPRDGLAIGRKAYSLDELREELDRPFQTLFGRVGEAFVAMRYGNVSHTSVAEGGRPFLDPAFTLSMIYRTGDYQQEGTAWVKQNLDSVLRHMEPAKKEVALPGFFPVTAQGLILYRTYDGVYAVVTRDGVPNQDGRPARAGEVYWIADTKGNLSTLMGGEDRPTAEKWWEFYKDNRGGLKTLLFENPLIGSLTHDGQNVYLVDDAAIPQPPPNYFNDMGGGGFPGGPGGMAQPPHSARLFGDGSRLLAVNIETGKREWELGGKVDDTAPTEEEEDREINPFVLTQNAFFLGPPLPLNGKLYVLFEKSGRIRLACLDPGKPQAYPAGGNRKSRAPELVWTQRLGEPNVRLPADTYRRFQCSYLAFADGVMVCPTNAGAVIAVDVMSRSLLWARSYRTVKPTDTPDAEMRMGGVRRVGRPFNPGAMAGTSGPLPQDRWRAAAPIVSNGRVVFAAFDSESADCLDLRTGDLLWSEPRRAGDLYVGGLVGDKVVIVGKESVRAVNLVGKPRPAAGGAGKEEVVAAWRPVPTGLPAGHGTASKGGVYYLPLAGPRDGGPPEVWAIDVEKGEVLAKTEYRKREGVEGKPMLGNLVFHEGQLFSQSPTELTMFPLIDIKKKEMDERLLANPKDPVGLVARGELNLDDGKLREAVADLKEAQRHDPPEPVRPRLREKLYQVYTELLRKDFAAGEPYLAEYRDLCEVRIDTVDPNLIQKLKDEQVRRKGLYLVLVAKGRERQGRLAEAFDLYREFAALGDNKQLVPIYDEPHGLTRPDVWARGRIEAMIRDATNPAARQPLEDRVAKEWAEVRSAGDADRLREFVRVFGPYFAAGREGQLLLAEKLIATGSDDDAREAEGLLLRLWATGEDRSQAARAVEALARLMTRRGLLDDAVGLYTQLGTRFPDVPVRDGKTGADFLNDLLTDKRLLPYLEPSRVPTPPRVKATEVRQAPVAGATGFAFEPDGPDASPFFRRHRLTLANDSGNNTWTLRVYDKATGAEVGRKAALKLFAPAGVPTHYRLAQAHGHLLLLHLGNTVYCLNPAERDEHGQIRQLWEYNVLGDAPPSNQNGGVSVMPATDPGAGDGEVFITYTDGSRLRLGRSAVLAGGIACLVTRDGLVGLDPLTGVKLWTRTTVGPSALIFGDGRHVFVVEATTDNKGRSLVFRAADGAAVDGVPDFGPLVAGSGRLRIIGRFVLAAEGGGSKPRVLRLYDPLAGKDVWRNQYPADAAVLRAPADDLTGAVRADGRFEVRDILSGREVFAGRLDEKYAAAHVQGLTTPLLLSDAERFFLVLNRSGGQRAATYYSSQAVRTTSVSGAVYCFDRGSGGRLWFADKLFEGQSLVVERFAELPALVSVTYTNEEGSPYGVHRVVVADKVNGKIRHLKNYSQNMGNFYALTTDLKAGSAKLVGGNVTLDIAPDADPKPAAR